MSIMQKVQRFSAAIFTPVLLFGVFGIFVAVAILLKNPMIVGSIANEGTSWWNFWYVVEQGAWTVFNQLPLLFAIGLPMGLAKSNQGRAAMEAFVIYAVFNYYVCGILTIWGPYFGVDFSQPAGSGTGLTMIANIKTLDTGMIGALVIATLATYLHDKFFDTQLPDILGLFRGSSMVITMGFILMLPVAWLFCYVWPKIQLGIVSLQGFLKSSGVFGVWFYTFLERILIPTGLHHFIYMPFIYGPAVVEGGIQPYWLAHIQEFAASTQPLMELFPQGGFALHGMSKMFGGPGIAAALYATARPENKKKIASLLIPATVVAFFCGITEPLEFTFLFVAPFLFLIHALLAGTMAATMYACGVTGNFGGGLLDTHLTQNWIPLFHNHGTTYMIQIGIGVAFTVIYFVLFRYLILKFDIKTPGREENASEIRLRTKAEYREAKFGTGAASGGKKLDERDVKAAGFLVALGGKGNIAEVTNCATRLRVNVKDGNLVQSEAVFREYGANGLMHKGNAVQVIVGLSVPQVCERFKTLLTASDAELASILADAGIAGAADANANVGEGQVVVNVNGMSAYGIQLRAFMTGSLIPIDQVPDEGFASKSLGDGIAINPVVSETDGGIGVVIAPADGTVSMVMDDSGHAVGLQLANGLEILLHVGIDTVNMKGDGFKLLVKEGQEVKMGDKLIEFDVNKIKAAGFSPITVMAVTNHDEYNALKFAPAQSTTANATIIATY